MKKKRTEIASKPTEKAAEKKQLKIFLTPNEHAVVTTAAAMGGQGIAEYMRAAVIERAKVDVRNFAQLVEKI